MNDRAQSGDDLAGTTSTAGSAVDAQTDAGRVTTAPVESIASMLPTEIRQRGIIRVTGTCGTAPPLRYRDPAHGTTVGCEVDLANLFADVLGLKVEFDTATWSESLARIDSGATDVIISDVTVTEELEQKYDFATYRADLVALQTRFDDPWMFADRKDLADKTIAVESRLGPAQKLEDWNGKNVRDGLEPITIEHLPDAADHREALATGCIDGYLQSYSVAKYESAATGATKIITTFPRSTDDRRGGIGVLTRRGNGLVRPFQQAINRTIDNGTYRQVLDARGLGNEAVKRSEIRPPGPERIGHLAKARSLLVLTTLAAAAVIVLMEIDRILGSVMVDGRSHTLGSVFGPFGGPSASTTAFNDWATVSGIIPVHYLVILYVVVDIVFIGVYCGLLVGLRGRFRYAWTDGRTPRDDERGWLVTRSAIAALAVVDLTEDGLTIGLALSLPDGLPTGTTWAASAGWTVPLYGFTLAKCLAVLVVLGSVIYGLVTLPRAGERWRRWIVAIKMQRFSLVIVIVMSVLMIFPGPDIFDQASDIERTWLLDNTWVVGLRHMLCAFFAFGLLTLLLVRLGDLRSARAHTIYPEIEPGTTKPKPDDRPDSNALWWLLAAGAILGVGVILSAIDFARPNCAALLAVAAVPAVISAIDWFVSLRFTPEVGQNPLVYPGAARAVRVVGDLLGLSVGVVLGLSMVRAFTVPAVLGIGSVLAPAGVVAGVVISVVVWWFTARWIGRRFRASGEGNGGSGSPWPIAERLRSWFDVDKPKKLIVAAGICILLVFVVPLLWPHLFGSVLGVIGVFAWGLSALALVLMVLATVAQSRRPLKVFRVLGLDATPMITIVLAAAVAASLVGGSGLTHQVRYPDAGLASQTYDKWKDRTFESSVRSWLGDAAISSCSIETSTPAGRTVHVKPMIFVAATGGGIRAAWWTVQAASELATSDCAKQAVIAASGASGGAVGLALMYSSKQPVEDARTMATAGPLAITTDGLIFRDLVSGFTGLDVAVANQTGDDLYPDRAGLMEQAWEASIPAMSAPFPAMEKPADTVGWHVFLNSTSARTGCRVVIGDVSTRTGAHASAAVAEPEAPECERTGGESGISGSYDLFAAHPCLLGLHTSTAALLASRFPYVTPSGVIADACPNIAGSGVDRSDQLIDGGYAENSGIGTLIELSEQAMPQVRAFNERQPAKKGDITVVVPMVISLENTPQVSAAQSTAGPDVGEALVPVLSGIRRGATLNDPTALLDRLTTSTSDWLPSKSDPGGQVRAAAARAIPDRSLVVAPLSAPGVAAPLGWVMSQASLDAMDHAMADLRPCAEDTPDVDCQFDGLLNRLQDGSG